MLAAVLLIAFGLPLATPLVAASTDSDSRLPACCRRHGIHHCTMGVAAALTSSEPALQAPPCPLYPSVATQFRITGATLAAQPQIAARVVDGASPAVAHDRVTQILAPAAHLTRGPPIHLL